jgi:transcriptional regulator with XRE-family HTH domain
MDIGKRIKKLRTQQKRTLQDIADECGFTKSLLSKIENEAVVPSISTLVKIAGALGVNVSILMEEESRNRRVYTISREIAEEKQVKTNQGYSFYAFAIEQMDKKIQPMLISGKKGEIIEHSLSHEGEEFIYMLEGEMKFRVGNVEYILGPGDSLYFDSFEKHGMLPLTDEIKYINVFSQ